MNSKTTSKGTELPLLNLRGKPYLQVAHRLVWFREDHPNGKISTEIVKLEADYAIVKAVISIPADSHYLELAQAHKQECKGDFGDFLEKAETGAIGRALAMAGYGTQFDPELDEEHRIVDSPIDPAKKAGKENESSKVAREAPGKTAAAKPEAPKGNRDLLNRSIQQWALIAIDKRVATSDQLKELIKKFGAERKEDLTDEQARSFLDKLKEMANG